jgi:hypothetical protein
VTQVLHGRIQYAKTTAESVPYRIGPSKTGWALYEMSPIGWAVIATFARRSDAELFIFAKAPPVWGEN